MTNVTTTPRKAIVGVGLAFMLLLTALGAGAEANTPKQQITHVPDGRTRYVSMSVSQSEKWKCPRIASVVQVRLRSVNGGGFTIDGMRVLDASGNGASISDVVAHAYHVQPNTSSFNAAPWRWGRWNNVHNHRLSWRTPNVSISVATPGQPWYCKKSRTLTLYPA